MRKTWIITVACLFISIFAGCSLPGTIVSSPTLDPNLILTLAAGTAFVKLTQLSAQATPTLLPQPSGTPIPSPSEVLLPTSIPTIEPVPGQVLSNANVRGVPGKDKTSNLGGLLQGQGVKVIARNDSADWFYILFSNSPSGTGWVLARAIHLKGDITTLPIVIFPNGYDAQSIMLPAFVFPTVQNPLPPSTPQPGWSKYGTLVQPANVRAGPSVGYVTISILKPGQIITFTGKTSDNVWVQIGFPSGPDGHGWVLASLVQAHEGLGGLPTYNYLGTPVGPSSQSGLPVATATPVSTNSDVQPTQTLSPSPISSVQGNTQVQLNVRSGPSSYYQVIGSLNANDKVAITGRTMSGLWFQIQFSSGPEGVGWVSSQYVSVLGDLSHVPYYYNEGTKVP